jgi:hypothetical protein
MTGCGKDGPDNPDNAVPDPEGTISYTLTKTSLYDEGNVLELGTGSIILTPASNLKVSNALICTVGKVNGLGNVTKIPSGNSWTTEIGAVLNQGYIVKLSDDSYMRLFIFDWDEEYNISASGVTYTRFYCKIKYQYPFEP